MKVAIIGLGSIAKKHINALSGIHPNCSFIAVRSTPGANVCDNITNAYSVSEIPAHVDFIIVSNPTSLHVSTIRELIHLKKPLLIEKPISNTLDGLDEVAELLEMEKIYTYIACCLRFNDSLNFAKRYIDGKRINEVNVYCGSYLPEWRPGKDYRMTYSAIKELGGGVNLDLIHEIDYVYWILGEPMNVTSIATSNSSLQIHAVDYSNYIMSYDHFNVSVILNYYRKDPKRCMEIVMEDETITVDIINNKVVSAQKGILFESNQNIQDLYTRQMEFFIDNIDRPVDKRCIFNDINEAIKILKIALNA